MSVHRDGTFPGPDTHTGTFLAQSERSPAPAAGSRKNRPSFLMPMFIPKQTSFFMDAAAYLATMPASAVAAVKAASATVATDHSQLYRQNGRHRIGIATPRQIDRHMSRTSGMQTTVLRDILPPKNFVQVPLERFDGEKLWSNRRFWQDVNPGLTYDPVQVEEDQRYFYYVDETPDETPSDRQKMGFSDDYRGGGSGRFVDLDDGSGIGNKGCKRTPHARRERPGGGHQDGRLSLYEAVMEVVGGEQLNHLEIPTTRVPEIDIPDWPWKGDKRVKSYSVSMPRTGPDFRPAHVIHEMGSFYKFGVLGLAAAKATGINDPKDQAVYLQYLFGRMAAKYRRWRIVHSIFNLSNMSFGASIDHALISAFSDTGPHHGMENSWFKKLNPWAQKNHIYGWESKVITSMAEKLTPSEFSGYSKNKKVGYDFIHHRAKEIEDYGVCGLKEEVAIDLVDDASTAWDADHLTYVLRQLERPFHANVPTSVLDPYQRSSVFDVYEFLEHAPRMFFDFDTQAERRPELEEFLSDQFYMDKASGTLPEEQRWRNDAPSVKKHIVRNAQEARDKIVPHLRTLRELYPKVMKNAFELGMKKKLWDNFRDFLECTEKRARFQNRPLTAFYLHDIQEKIRKVLEKFERNTKSTDDDALYETEEWAALRAEIQRIIEDVLAESVRNLNAMFYNTPVHTLESDEPGPIEDRRFLLQPSTLDDIDFYCEANLRGERKVHVEVPFDKFPSRDLSQLDDESLAEMVKVTRTDETGGSADAVVFTAPSRSSDQQVLHIVFPAKRYEYGDLRGSIKIGNDTVNLDNGSSRYIYAIPDRAEFDKILDSRGLTDIKTLMEQNDFAFARLDELDQAAKELVRIRASYDKAAKKIGRFFHVSGQSDKEKKDAAEQAFEDLMPMSFGLSPNSVLEKMDSPEHKNMRERLHEIKRRLMDWEHQDDAHQQSESAGKKPQQENVDNSRHALIGVALEQMRISLDLMFLSR
jgi:hypothetical protein